jgi:hypothetical protein
MKINSLDLPIDLHIKLFDQTILPILIKESELWGYDNLDLIEQFNVNFLRRESTPRYMLYAKLGHYPIDVTIKSRLLNS